MLADQLEETRGEIERARSQLARAESVLKDRVALAVATAARRLDALAAQIEASGGAA